MFLTTNRVQTFDAAFQSRIHISLEYSELDKKSRKGIWQGFLDQHNIVQAAAREKPPATFKNTADVSKKRSANDSATDSEGDTEENKKSKELHHKLTQPHQMSEKDIDKLADLRLNGRQIKNFLKTAQLLSVYKEEPLSYRHVDTVVSETQHLHRATEATEQSRAGIFN